MEHRWKGDTIVVVRNGRAYERSWETSREMKDSIACNTSLDAIGIACEARALEAVLRLHYWSWRSCDDLRTQIPGSKKKKDIRVGAKGPAVVNRGSECVQRCQAYSEAVHRSRPL